MLVMAAKKKKPARRKITIVLSNEDYLLLQSAANLREWSMTTLIRWWIKERR